MSATNGTSPDALRFQVIPHDMCSRCPPPERIADQRLGLPVAFAQEGTAIIVRYVCPVCRLLWDCSFAADEPRPGGTFSDTFVCDREGLESHPQGEIQYPCGPRSMLKRGVALPTP